MAIKQVIVSAQHRAARMAEIAKALGKDRSNVPECTFEPNEEFTYLVEDEGTGGRTVIAQYCLGNTYNCTRFEVHDFLREAIAEWDKEGLVTIYPVPKGKKFVMTSVPEAVAKGGK